MRATQPVKFALLLVVTIVAGACARAVAVESESGVVYTIEVTNPQAYDLVVSYADPQGTHMLGTVRAGSQQTFVITSPGSRSIQVIGVSEDRTRTIRQDVTLVRGMPARVNLTG